MPYTIPPSLPVCAGAALLLGSLALTTSTVEPPASLERRIFAAREDPERKCPTNKGIAAECLGSRRVLRGAAIPLAARGRDANHEVQLAGVRAVLAEYGEGFEGLHPFNTQATGITVGLLIRASEKNLVAVDRDGSRIAVFQDDRRTAILGETFQDGVGAFPEVADDRAAAMVEVFGSQLPHPRAKSIRLEGSIALQTASKTDTLRSAAVQLQQRSDLEVGAWKFEITEVETSGDTAEVELQTSRDPSAIQTFRFRGANGSAIESEGAGTSSMRSGDSGTWTFSFRLTGPPDRVSLEVDTWTDLETVQVPIDLEFAIPR